MPCRAGDVAFLRITLSCYLFFRSCAGLVAAAAMSAGHYDFGRLAFFVLLAFLVDFLAGTFFPSFRASERPIAIACFRLLTVLPERPLFKVPFFRLCNARATFFVAASEYFRAMEASAIDDTAR